MGHHIYRVRRNDKDRAGGMFDDSRHHFTQYRSVFPGQVEARLPGSPASAGSHYHGRAPGEIGIISLPYPNGMPKGNSMADISGLRRRPRGIRVN
jgi:hypothetical protein